MTAHPNMGNASLTSLIHVQIGGFRMIKASWIPPISISTWFLMVFARVNPFRLHARLQVEETRIRSGILRSQ
jgi:hypothetical protein